MASNNDTGNENNHRCILDITKCKEVISERLIPDADDYMVKKICMSGVTDKIAGMIIQKEATKKNDK